MASRYAAEVIVSHIKRSRERNPIRVLRSAIETANERVLEKAAENEELSGMGTTVVAATVVENYLYVANVGDSRLYLIRDHIRQITRDHSLVGEMVRAGELSRSRREITRTRISSPEQSVQDKNWRLTFLTRT